MMKPLLFAVLTLFVTMTTQLIAQNTAIFPKGEKAPNVHHTGDVWLRHLSNADAIFKHNITVATFVAGAKLDWHIHPQGQQLLILEGVGYYQERGESVRVVRKGDVIKCSPNVEHWHAATPGKGVTYLSITGNQPTKWLEKVPDEFYLNVNEDSLLHKFAEEEIINLSQEKWLWMSEKKVEMLENLFHENAVFVHMGGTWGKELELNIIQSGGIHYKKADIHEVSVNIIDDTAILLNRITLLAVVGGNEVTNPFMVTEVYKQQNGEWKLASLSFTKLMNSQD